MTSGSGPNKRRLPAGLGLTLLMLLVAVALVLTTVWIRGRRSEQAIVLSGPLLQVPTERISGLMFTRQGGQYRFDRQGPDVWSLSGATSDFLDARSLGFLLTNLTQAFGGPVLPGTEPEDPRYDFNTPEAMRLTFFTTEGERMTLAVGALNPVTGHSYASGLNRAGCFMIAAETRQALVGLPGSVELTTLLPAVSDTSLVGIELWRGRTKHHLERRDSRWWLKVPALGLAALDERVAAYNRYYFDRIRHETDGDWVLAATAVVRALVHETTRTVVKEIKPVNETTVWREKWGLDTPWRTVRLLGPGINPDPGARSPDAMELAFGVPLSSLMIPVKRREVVLVADGQAGQTLEAPLGELTNRLALTRPAMEASALEIRRDGRLLVSGEKAEGPREIDGRELWKTTIPSATGPQDGNSSYGVGEIIVDMDRMPMLAALPPVKEPSPLQARELVEVALTYDEAGGAQREVFQVGFLTDTARKNLPIESESASPVALWRPTTGQLLLVNDFLLVTSRNLANR
ncbi:hypothetical protein COW53_10805 [bacterium CG17_big_fil_post_rev_8_21_14_2_50_64_8]|nr:MAG: hypothetical protein COW53_10805 [bacterium CG17_big_fil_post_rev_8_21_14_2_50_64_8]PJA74249.1 MAG: hypothetical protein CO151_10365 [bacterium CG_4_9_14_3_um_filter_65_15]